MKLSVFPLSAVPIISGLRDTQEGGHEALTLQRLFEATRLTMSQVRDATEVIGHLQAKIEEMERLKLREDRRQRRDQMLTNLIVAKGAFERQIEALTETVVPTKLKGPNRPPVMQLKFL